MWLLDVNENILSNQLNVIIKLQWKILLLKNELWNIFWKKKMAKQNGLKGKKMRITEIYLK